MSALNSHYYQQPRQGTEERGRAHRIRIRSPSQTPSTNSDTTVVYTCMRETTFALFLIVFFGLLVYCCYCALLTPPPPHLKEEREEERKLLRAAVIKQILALASRERNSTNTTTDIDGKGKGKGKGEALYYIRLDNQQHANCSRHRDSENSGRSPSAG